MIAFSSSLPANGSMDVLLQHATRKQAGPLLGEFTKNIAMMMNVPTCFVSMLDSERQWLVAKHGVSIESTARNISFCQFVLERGEPVIVENALKDSRFADNPLVIGDPYIRFYAGFPLKIHGEINATLCLVDTKENKLSEQQLKIMKGMAQAVETLVEFGFATELSHEEHDLLNHSPASLIRWTFLPAQRLQFVSSNTVALFGLNLNCINASEWHIEDAIYEEDKQTFLQAIHNHKTGASCCETAFRIKTNKRHEVWIKQFSIGVFDKNNELIAVNALLIDYSQQKGLEKRLLTNSERMRLMIDAAELGTWDWDITTGVNTYNRRFCDMLGLDVDFIDHSPLFWEQFIHPVDASGVRHALDAHLEQRTDTFHYQYRMQHQQGHWVWIETTAKVNARHPDGSPIRLTGIHRDVSEKKNSEIAKERQQALMNLINKAQTVFIDSLDIQHACTEIFGDFLRLTESDFGFIGQVIDIDDAPAMHVHAITDISWSDDSSEYYQRFKAGNLYFTNLDNLFGSVITSGESVVTNQPALHARARGTPKGHPPISRFMGLPIKSGGKVIGTIGVANKITDYSPEDAEFLQPMLNTLGSLFYALESEKARRTAEQRLIALANTDALTGLANRRSFLDTCEHHLATHKAACCIAILDVDFFKAVNDTYGHKSGDDALILVAQILQANVRTDDIVARLGGEEFGIFLLDTDEESATDALNAMRQRIEAHALWLAEHDKHIHLTVSIGADINQDDIPPAQYKNLEKRLQAADEALYRAKREGRNRLCFSER